MCIDGFVSMLMCVVMQLVGVRVHTTKNQDHTRILAILTSSIHVKEKVDVCSLLCTEMIAALLLSCAIAMAFYTQGIGIACRRDLF